MKTIRLLLALAFTVLAPALRADPPLGANLEGYWKFDNNGADTSGLGRDLTLAGGVGFAAGVQNQALALPGDTAQFASRAVDDAAFNFGSGDFTVQVWVKYNSTGGEQVLIEKFSGGNGPGWTLTKRDSNRLEFYTGAQGGFDSDVLAITAGVWHQVVARRSGPVLTLFYDGVAAATFGITGDISTSPNGLLIGKRNPADGRGFAMNGAEDEAAIWSRALSDSEIATLYATFAGPGPGAPTVTALAPSNLTTTSATLRAAVNPNLVDTTVEFRMDGVFPFYSVGTVNVPAGATEVTVPFNITGYQPGTTHTVYCFATNAGGEAGPSGVTFTFLGGAPTVTALAPSNLTTTSATLRAAVNPNLVDTTVDFRVDGPFPFYSVGTVNVPAGATEVTVPLNISGYVPGTTHTVICYATNAGGEATPSSVQFTFLGGAPTVTTLAPSNVTTTTATLRATVNPNLVDTGVNFYLDGAFGANHIGTVNIPAGATDVAVTFDISGFVPGSTHSVQATAENSAGAVFGNSVTFTFLGGAPTVTTLAPSNVTTTTATLRATVNPNLVDTGVNFYLDGAFGANVTGTVNIPAGATDVTVTFDISGLVPHSTHTVQATAENSVGAVFGNSVTFTAEDPILTTVATVVYTGAKDGSGSQVPGAAAGTTFVKFGVPALNDAGKIALTGAAIGPDGGVLMVDDVAARKGGSAPDAGGSPSGLLFTSFKDPALTHSGALAFLAGLDGATPSQGLFTDLGGTLRRVVQSGGPAPGIAGVTIEKITAFAATDDAVFFTGKLLAGPGVDPTDDQTLWGWTYAGGAVPLLRKGDMISGRQIKGFVTLKSGSGSAGHGRSSLGDGVVVRVIFADGSVELLSVDSSDMIEALASSGENAPDVAGAMFKTFGLPVFNANGGAAFLSTLTGAPKTIFADVGGARHAVFQLGENLPVLNLTEKGFKDPVYNADESVAVLATLAGAGVTPANKTAILLQPAAGAVQVVARTGDEPAGVPGAQWKAFKSVALPDGMGPVFVATMAFSPGVVDATSDVGLWAQASNGTLFLLAREGSALPAGGKTVKTFTVLKSVSGSPDQTRSFNHNKQVVIRAAYTDGTSAIVNITVP